MTRRYLSLICLALDCRQEQEMRRVRRGGGGWIVEFQERLEQSQI